MELQGNEAAPQYTTRSTIVYKMSSIGGNEETYRSISLKMETEISFETSGESQSTFKYVSTNF
jgi:hypothetical protein